MERVVLHIDMDAFFAAIEQRDHPEYRGKPVVVGAPPDKRGVISAASYEARRYGIHSAMPSRSAYAKCPRAIFLPVNFKRYEEVSAQIMEIFLKVTPKVEPLSLDEAFLDVSQQTKDIESGMKIATQIKEQIYKKTKLTCSVGIAPNKFLAKIASDFKKPNGFVVVRAEQALPFLRPLPVRRIWGVGPVTEQFLKEKGFRHIGDLQRLSLADLTAKIGSLAESMYALSRGEDDSPVEPNRVPKSMSRETTFEKDVTDTQILNNVLEVLAKEVSQSLQEEGYRGKTIVLKLRYSDFETHTRQNTLKHTICEEKTIEKVGKKLLEEHLDPSRPVRLIGLGVTHFAKPGQDEPLQLQMDLFPYPY